MYRADGHGVGLVCGFPAVKPTRTVRLRMCPAACAWHLRRHFQPAQATAAGCRRRCSSFSISCRSPPARPVPIWAARCSFLPQSLPPRSASGALSVPTPVSLASISLIVRASKRRSGLGHWVTPPPLSVVAIYAELPPVETEFTRSLGNIRLCRILRRRGHVLR
jgi:hypothetical protein